MFSPSFIRHHRRDYDDDSVWYRELFHLVLFNEVSSRLFGYSAKSIKWMVALVSLSLLNGCLGMPDTVKPVDNFELNRYLGTWYEIARLDHSFEEGLEQVSADYLKLPNGGISVRNRGYDPEEREWVEASGQAFFVNQDDQGYLQVSFFGPFYSSYVIFELDKNGYQYAFVSGPSYDYLWLLSRTPTVSEELKNQFRHKAHALGFNTDELIFVKQDQ